MIKLAIIGCGYWGINYVRVFSEIPDVCVKIACDQNPERLQVIRERYPLIDARESWEETVSDREIDAVVIAAPARDHYLLSRGSLSNGKHVLVEKPLASDVSQAEALVREAKESGRILMVGHTFLYNAGIRKMKELMSSDSFGRIHYLHATRTNMGPIRRDVNVVWDLASHDIAIFNYLLDAEPIWVSAVGSRVFSPEREDVGFVALNYPRGVIASIHTSWLDPNKVREVVVVGSQRRIVFDDLKNLERVRIFEKGVGPAEMEADSFGEFRLLVRDGDIISPWIEPSEPLRNLALHFLECVRGESRPITDAVNGLSVVRVLAAIDKSLAERGAPVNVS
ncbi:MAG TPA: Gfo/Idh/MocA family oxidoreductase [Blastocatellia bacterium]|jgi:predicted dehydrogenase|nr:Gfo/Idh/MocA family oxidoreductase [Blastocatellia bacterium]